MRETTDLIKQLESAQEELTELQKIERPDKLEIAEMEMLSEQVDFLDRALSREVFKETLRKHPNWLDVPHIMDQLCRNEREKRDLRREVERMLQSGEGTWSEDSCEVLDSAVDAARRFKA